ncbi:cellulose synthase subunit BcsC-related outer membrane protein [Variovorax sp. J22P168]|uniref:cellulose biosynthesis protein BcsC n=1 Tax=Variovorax jilinensis TaxID=3053513 RepID=UPI0025768755|nr:cellulose biosynthesis protein BcsC [Variovorax sp. J22P168]MDM0013473.1 cellulose synthase subunit BcsC-related outer membrane protein [Variovorax sp. J22P168]
MPRHPTRLSSTPGRLLACLGLIGALHAGAPAHAQDAKAALIEQGNYWQSMGRTDLAEESWQKLLRVDPQSADALYGMSQVELARGKAEPARDWLAKLRAAHPSDPRASTAVQTQGGTPQTDLQRARAASKAGRTAEAIALYRAVFGANRTPPEPLAVEYYQLLSGTPQGWEEGRKGLEQLVKDKPDNAAYRLALAQLQTYREPTRREGIRSLAELSKQPGVGAAATASWRQALIWLDAREADSALYDDYLSTHPDPAVQARLDSLRAARTAAATASPAAQPLGEGYKALDRGDAATAEQRFQQALRAEPGDPEALGGLGLIRLRQERFAEAQQLLEQASRGAGGRKWASALQSATYWNLVRQANVARDKGDARSAQALLERAVKADPREPVGQIALAELQLANGNLAAAEQGFRQALEAKPSDPQALRGMISVYTRQGRNDEAATLTQKLSPDQLRQLGNLQDVRVEAARAKARAQTDAGDVAGAQRTLEDAMLAAPDSPWVRLDLANLYRRQGMTAQARGVMDGLLMSQPDMPDALFASALLASEAGDPAAGLQYLDRIPAASRTRDMTQLQRRLWAAGQAQQAQALARQGQVAAARGVLAQTEAALGNDMPPELWGQLASAYADIGDAPRALAMSRQLLARSANPGVGDRLLYATVLLKTQQDVELTAVLRQLQQANMTTAQRADFERLNIALALRQTDALREAGNLEAAYNAMAPVLAARPDDPQVLAALARLYAAARDEKQALALYQRILQRSPTDLDTLLAAASSASALRAHGDAESYVQAALKQAPDQSRVLAAAGRVYRNAGDNARAEQYLRAAVAADSRAAGGAVTARPGAVPVAPSNPFAGMTGGAAAAGAPFGATLQPVGLPAGAYPATAAAAASPFAGMRGGAAAPVAALPPLPAVPAAPAYAAAPGYPAQPAYPAYPGAPAYAGAAAMPQANLPWGSGGNTAALPAGQTAARTATRSSTSTSATQTRRTGSKGSQAEAGPNAPATSQPLAPVAAQYAQAYPPTYPQSAYPQPAYPGQNAGQPLYLPAPAPGSSLASETTWNTAPIGTAPANPLLAELQDLQAERSTTIDIGSVYRNRDGESGLSRLQDLQVPIEARFPAGSGKVVVGITPTVLDNGAMAQDYGTTSRFGGGPQAAIDQLAGRVTGTDGQNASGVGLSVGYEGKNLNASIGTTPLGFQETNVVGGVSYGGALSDTVTMKGELSRRAVTDSLLSFAGTEDPRNGDRWGGVVATGGRLDVTRDDGTYGIYGYGLAHSITGRNVADNSRYELGGGMYVHLLKKPGSSLTVGMNVDLLGYDKNLSYFTYGQGGYFSPESYVSVAFPVDWTGRDDRLSWRLNASLGIQSFTQDASPWFPTDPARQAQAASAVAQATGLGLNRAPFTGYYIGSSHTGVAYNLAGVVEYQVAPQLFLGGAMAFNNAQNYRQISVSAYLRYMLGNSGRYASPGSGSTLKPVSSPYTPLL